MTSGQLMDLLQKHFKTPYEMKMAVMKNRENQPSWNWFDSAKNLLNQLESK